MQNAKKTGKNRQAPMLASGVIRRDSIDGIPAAIGEFFELEATQLEAGSFHSAIEFAGAGEALAYRENYPRNTHLAGSLRGRRFGISIPLATADSMFCGTPIAADTIAASIGGREFDYSVRAGFAHIVVLVDADRILAEAEAACLPRTVVNFLDRHHAPSRLGADPAGLARLRSTLETLLDQSPHGKPPPADLEDALLEGLVDALDSPNSHADHIPAPATLVRRALELADSGQPPVRIGKLCADLRASPRTLETAFLHVTGTSPATFFRLRQLNRARRLLLDAPARAGQVTEIATRLGFTELGRFAVGYKSIFGEKPSQTLRRRPTAISIPRDLRG